MIFLQQFGNSGYTYIDEDGNYVGVVHNFDCNAPDEEYPLFLDQPMEKAEFDEIPF